MNNLSTNTRVLIAAALAALLPLQAIAFQDQTAPTSDAIGASTDHTKDSIETGLRKLELKEGSPVVLSLASALNSKSCREGDPVRLTVAGDVKVDNAIVVRAGATAMGHIARVKKSGMMGRGGELSIDLDYMQVNDTVVKLRGSRGKDGQDKTGAVVGLTVAFGLVGFMKHGKQAEIPAGTNVQAYVDRAVELPALNPQIPGAHVETRAVPGLVYPEKLNTLSS